MHRASCSIQLMGHVPFLYRPRLAAAVFLLRSFPLMVAITLVSALLLDPTDLAWYEGFVLALAGVGWAVTFMAFCVFFLASVVVTFGPDRQDEGRINNQLWKDAWHRVRLRKALPEAQTRLVDAETPSVAPALPMELGGREAGPLEPAGTRRSSASTLFLLLYMGTAAVVVFTTRSVLLYVSCTAIGIAAAAWTFLRSRNPRS